MPCAAQWVTHSTCLNDQLEVKVQRIVTARPMSSRRALPRPECDKPAAEAGELIRRQLGNSFGDFFDFHVVQYSTAGASLSDGKGLVAPAAATLELRFRREARARSVSAVGKRDFTRQRQVRRNDP